MSGLCDRRIGAWTRYSSSIPVDRILSSLLEYRRLALGSVKSSDLTLARNSSIGFSSFIHWSGSRGSILRASASIASPCSSMSTSCRRSVSAGSLPSTLKRSLRQENTPPSSPSSILALTSTFQLRGSVKSCRTDFEAICSAHTRSESEPFCRNRSAWTLYLVPRLLRGWRSLAPMDPS